MKIKARGTQIHLNIFMLAVPILMLIAGYIKEYAAAFFSIMLHEMGHVAVAHIYGCGTNDLRVTPFGFSVSINDKGCSRKALILIYLAGPIVNLLIFGAANIAALVLPHMEDLWKTISITNIFFALFNLVPAFPLDGGRILLEALAEKVGLLGAGRLIYRLTLLISVTILLAGAYQFYISAFNISLIVIALYIIILLRTGRMESAIMNIRQIIFRRTRLFKKGIYPARDLVVVKSTLLSETLKNMDFDRFHMVYVLDDRLRLLRVLTESEIMDAIVGGGENMTFELLLKSIENQGAEEKAFRNTADI